MALQSRINEIYPNRKPFMEPVDGKRKATGKDLRVRPSCCCCCTQAVCDRWHYAPNTEPTRYSAMLSHIHLSQVQALLGAQEAAKRQCTDGGVPQEQQPPMGDFQQQDGTDQT